MNRVVISFSSRSKLLVIFFCCATHWCVAQLEYPTGTKSDDAAYDQIEPYDINLYKDLNLPRTYSLKGFLPKVGNQLKLPQDIPWSISHAVTIVLNSHSIATDVVDNRSPYFINMLLSQHMDPCNESISLNQAIDLLENTGLPSIREYFNLCPDKVDQQIVQLSRLYEKGHYEKVFKRDGDNDHKIRRIKSKLALDQPVVASFHCPPSFVLAKDFWSPKEQYSDEYPLHTVTIVGYDDEIYGGVFEAVNTWGKNWGNNGYMYIRYEDMQFFRYGYSVSTYADEGESFTIIKGNFSLKEATTKELLDVVRFSSRGYFQLSVEDDELDFFAHAGTNKPFYLKMYYKTGDEVTMIYPNPAWRSSLFQFSYDSFDLPGDDNFYSITKDLFSAIYIFMSVHNIDDENFEPLVSKHDNLSDILETDEYKMSRTVIWDRNTTFSGKLLDEEIIPVLIDLSFEK